jgi:hypothetical protein
MKRTLIGLAIGQVALLVGILAGYLVAIAATLRRVSQVLARVTVGVRAIERQTEPIGETLRDVNADLEAVANTLGATRQAGSPRGQQAQSTLTRALGSRHSANFRRTSPKSSSAPSYPALCGLHLVVVARVGGWA